MSSDRPRKPRQLPLALAAIAIVLTVGPMLSSLVEFLRPAIEQLSARYTAASQPPQGEFLDPEVAFRQGRAPTAAILVDPSRGGAFAESLGGQYELSTEPPATLAYIDEAISTFKAAQVELSVSPRDELQVFAGSEQRAELTLTLEKSVEQLKRVLVVGDGGAGKAAGGGTAARTGTATGDGGAGRAAAEMVAETDEAAERHLAELSTYIEAELEGRAFHITPREPVRLTATTQDELNWEWTVEPANVGEHKLTATLTAIFVVSGVEYPEPLSTVEAALRVTRHSWAPTLRFYDSSGKWILAFVVLPTAAWVIRKYARRPRPCDGEHKRQSTDRAAI